MIKTLRVPLDPEILEWTEQDTVVVEINCLAADQVDLLAEDPDAVERIGVDPLAIFAVIAEENQSVIMVVFDEAVDRIFIAFDDLGRDIGTEQFVLSADPDQFLQGLEDLPFAG